MTATFYLLGVGSRGESGQSTLPTEFGRPTLSTSPSIDGTAVSDATGTRDDRLRAEVGDNAAGTAKGKITVLVVDEAGDPVPSIPIMAAYRSSTWRLGESNEFGLCVIQVAKYFQSLLDSENLKLFLDGAFTPASRRFVSSEDINQTIVLTAPNHGGLQLVLVDEEARPVAGDFMVQISGHNATSAQTGFTTPSEATSGAVYFTRVGLGEKFLVKVYDGSLIEVANAEVNGPKVMGEDVQAVILLELPSKLVGRLLDQSGRPLCSMSLESTFLCDEQESRRSWTTDLEGRFSHSVARSAQDGEGRLVLLVASEDRHTVWTVETRLVLPLPRGVLDLGDLAARPLQCLVAGYVQASSGDPLHNATVVVECSLGPWNEIKEQIIATTDQDGAHTIYRPSVGEELGRITAQTDEDGKFAVYGLWEGQVVVQLMASAQGYSDYGPSNMSAGVSGYRRIVLDLEPVGRRGSSQD